jgi:hypothetical protein
MKYIRTRLQAAMILIILLAVLVWGDQIFALVQVDTDVGRIGTIGILLVWMFSIMSTAEWRAMMRRESNGENQRE